MNLTNPRTRRSAVAFGAVAAVTAAGITVGAAPASAATLGLTPSDTNVVTLDVGAMLTSVQTLTSSAGVTTYTLTYGANTTGNLNAADSPATVEAALNALASVIAAGGVTVTGSALNANGNRLTVTFNNTGVRTAVTATPAAGTITPAVTTPGLATLPQPLANATYAIRTTSTVSGLRLMFDSYTAPAGVTVTPTPTLQYSQQAVGSATGPTGGWTSVRLGAGGTAGTSSALTASQDTFLTANAPGTYKLRLVDPGASAGTDDDVVSDQVSMTVLDVEDVTAATTDDWMPQVTVNPTAATIGAPLSASVSLAGLDLVDARSSSGGVGLLANAINNLVGISFTAGGALGTNLSGGATDYTVPAAGTLSGTVTSRRVPVGVVQNAGTVTATAVFDQTGNGLAAGPNKTLDTESTVFTTNNVSAVTALDATEVVGSVNQTSATTVLARGTVGGTNAHRSITFTATVTDADADDSGNIVYFTIGGTDAADVSTDKTTVDATARIFSSVTDADGKARITVTDNAATPAGYTITASSNGVNLASPVTVTYAAPAVTTVDSTNTPASLVPSVGDSVTLTGRLLDQFLAAYTPTNAQSQQVTVAIDQNVGGACTFGSADITAFATLSNGQFSYNYSPATAQTPGQCDVARFTYGGVTQDVIIRWATNAAASSITVTAPANNATGVRLAEVDTLNTIVVSGNVRDANGVGLAYKTLTLTGSPGVYFSLEATGDDAATSLPVTTDANGDYSEYAFFTKSGAQTITATSGAASTQVAVTVNPSDQASTQAGSGSAPESTSLGDDFPYRVTVDSATATAGDTLVVTGKVTDLFSNAVRNAVVTLSTGSSTVGALTTNTVVTNQEGVWATTFVTGSNQSGDVTLTATLAGQTTDRTAGTAFDVTGLNLLSGDFQSTGTITVKPTETEQPTTVTLNAPQTDLGGGAVQLSGITTAGSVVEILARNADGDLIPRGYTTADNNGNYSVSVNITRTTTFVARVLTKAVSQPQTVTVQSTVRLTVQALGRGRVKLTAVGGPGAVGTATFHVVRNGANVRIATKPTSTSGAAAVIYTTTRGVKTFRATFQAPGTVRSALASKSVRVL